jgi:hypothetical protein
MKSIWRNKDNIMIVKMLYHAITKKVGANATSFTEENVLRISEYVNIFIMMTVI